MGLEVPLTLYSTAANKGEMLVALAKERGWDPSLISRVEPIEEVDEKNHWKSSRDLFLDKTVQLWQMMSIGLNGVGIGVDQHPKIKGGSKLSYRLALTKDRRKLNNLTHLETEKKGLMVAEHVHDSFQSIKFHERVSTRLMTGAGLFNPHSVFAMITEKLYIHYPRHPFPDTASALDYVVFAREKNVDASGVPDNLRYERNANSAGSVLQRTMILWFVESYRQPVLIDSVSDDPLQEVEYMGSCFTPALLEHIEALACTADKCRCAGVLSAGNRPIYPDKRYKVEWSPSESAVVTSYVGNPMQELL